MNLTNIPNSPGVYIYRDNLGKVIYVGKAINLKKRVSQYFHRDDALGPKTTVLVSQIATIKYKIVSSEIEALILESKLIKKYLPKYNSQLKDDRSYIYICITREPIPRVFSIHKSLIENYSADIYGPFPNGSAVRSILTTLRKIYPYRGKEINHRSNCLYCHIGLCPGANPDSVLYRQNIKNIKKILNGHIHFLLQSLKLKMGVSSISENYEEALSIRHQIESLTYITSSWKNLAGLLDSVDLPDDKTSSAINELLTVLKPYFTLSSINRIECYDISNLNNRYFVGSMVVFQDNRIDNSQYRQFKINTKVTPDDQFMIKEVVFRRLQHSEWGTPDLIIVDGGKPQVSAVISLSIKHIPIIGLSKLLETIVIKLDDNWVEINLPLRSNALRLLQSLRDEAHRFANRYRRKLIKSDLLLK